MSLALGGKAAVGIVSLIRPLLVLIVRARPTSSIVYGLLRSSHVEIAATALPQIIAIILFTDACLPRDLISQSRMAHIHD